MSAGDIIYVFVVLILLLAAVYVVVFFMKKFMFRYNNGALQNVDINLVAINGIMPKKYIGIVKVADDFYLIGISENNITMLDKLDSEKFQELNFVENNSINEKFSDVLKKAFNKK